jgi:hypothetical protein
MLPAAIVKILIVAAVINLIVIVTDQACRTLFWGQVFIFLQTN